MKLLKTTILTRKVDGKDTPYLKRTTLFSCRLFSIKLHTIYLSDPIDMHDHSWDYISLILKGGYYEWTVRTFVKEVDVKKWYRPGKILFRKAGIPHRLELRKGQKSCTTLVFTSHKKRDWGFRTKEGWKCSQEVLAAY